MKRIVGALVAAVALAAAGCGDEKTTEFCDQSCTIWSGCGWDFDTCMAQCKSDADWDKAYLECLQAHTCATLDDCG